MIFGNMQNLNEFSFLDTAVKECFAYASDHNLSDYDPGSHAIDGARLFVNIVEYTTEAEENRFWEAHQDYLDLHLMLQGTERIDLNFIANMQQNAYQPKDDFLPLEGDKNSSVILKEGDFLICYPNDGHRTAIQVNSPETIKKAIFKISIKD